MDHELILKMIEEADPTDTAKLDEIDARVYQLLTYPDSNPNILVYKGSSQCPWDEILKLNANPKIPIWKEYARYASRYTRSRDALKTIRPEGYIFGIEANIQADGYEAYLHGPIPKYKHSSPPLPTEELAELHAIIQAIAYERKDK